MKLESVQLQDFRQYCGSQTAQFSTEKERNVTVFHGLNGAGKTGLFSAISWCLYGTSDSDIGELINKATLSKAQPGENVSTAVTVKFRHQGSLYIVRRALDARKAPGGGTRPAPTTTATMFRLQPNGNYDPVRNVTETMNSILSSSVRQYFFFDGEKMDDLTRAGNTEVRDAVRNIMRLPALERAEIHLDAIAKDFRRELKKLGFQELEELIAKEENLRSSRQNLIRRRGEVQVEIEKAREKIAEVEEKLRRSAGARDLQKQRDSVNRSLTSFGSLKDQRVSDIQRVVNGAYLQFVQPTLVRALAFLDEKREKGEIPSGVREQVVKDLLEKHSCICGRPFCDGDEVSEQLRKLLNRATTSKMEQEVGQLAITIRQASGVIERQQHELGKSSKEHHDLLERIEEERDTLSEINHKLEGVNDQEIASVEGLRRTFSQQFEILLLEEGQIKNQVEQTERDLGVLQTQKAAAEAKEQRVAGFARKEKIAQNATDAVTRLKEAFFEETRKTVEASTKAVFGRLAWKQEHFQDVNIDEMFRLEVIDRWGTPTRRELSAGERQILSLAFICALSQESGEEAPLVMDTPFGRLSGNHLTEVARNLPDLTPQLILFVTDREWDEASQTQLAPRAGRQYRLEFHQSTGCTQIEEVH